MFLAVIRNVIMIRKEEENKGRLLRKKEGKAFIVYGVANPLKNKATRFVQLVMKNKLRKQNICVVNAIPKNTFGMD